MSKKKWVMANWKMNANLAMVNAYIDHLNRAYLKAQDSELVIFPPSIYLPIFAERAAGQAYHWGAQNIAQWSSGAYTGEIAASMVHDFSCDYVLLGHSERRQWFHEDEKMLANKFYLSRECGMIPILCIGESLLDYQKGQTQAVLRQQLSRLKELSQMSFNQTMIAYEPVWAIGTGLTPNEDEIHQILLGIKDVLKELDEDVGAIPLLYGGSVTPQNAQSILGIEPCQGLLVGGASLKVEHILEIIQCTICC